MGSDEIERVAKLFPTVNLTDTERRIVTYLLDETGDNARISIRDVAQRCYTSMTSVTRVAKKLGYAGFREMVYGLHLNEMGRRDSILSSSELRASLVYRNEHLQRFYGYLDARELIGVKGEGYSHLISEYIQTKLLGRGFPVVEQSYLDADQFIHSLGPRLSMMIVISKSGTTPAMVRIVDECKEHRIPLAAFVGNERSPVADAADMLFLVEDDQPLDSANVEPGSFTGCCILAFERLLYKYQTAWRAKGESAHGVPVDVRSADQRMRKP